MSGNVLTFNPSITEFLVIGLRQQLSELSFRAILLPNSATVSLVGCALNLHTILDKETSLMIYTALPFARHASSIFGISDAYEIRLITLVHTCA